MSSETRSTDYAGRTDSGDPMLVTEDLNVSYDEITAIRGVDIYLEEGEIISIIGPNGAGKTTLVDTICGWLPYEGSIRYRGNEIASKSTDEIVQEGVIYCTESRDLFSFLDVEQNLKLGAYVDDTDLEERLDYVYDLFPPLAERKGQYANTMSGGEQQMLAIGRSLMGDPELLIIDEPTLGLAPVIVEDISDAIETIQEEGVTILLCEQNVTFAANHADRIYLLENGRVEREGSPDNLLADEYIRNAYMGG